MPIDAIHDCIAARTGVRTNCDLHAVSIANVLMYQGRYRVIELDVMWIRSGKNCLKLRAANMSCKAHMQHMLWSSGAFIIIAEKHKNLHYYA